MSAESYKTIVKISRSESMSTKRIDGLIARDYALAFFTLEAVHNMYLCRVGIFMLDITSLVTVIALHYEA